MCLLLHLRSSPSPSLQHNSGPSGGAACAVQRQWSSARGVILQRRRIPGGCPASPRGASLKVSEEVRGCPMTNRGGHLAPSLPRSGLGGQAKSKSAHKMALVVWYIRGTPCLIVPAPAATMTWMVLACPRFDAFPDVIQQFERMCRNASESFSEKPRAPGCC